MASICNYVLLVLLLNLDLHLSENTLLFNGKYSAPPNSYYSPVSDAQKGNKML